MVWHVTFQETQGSIVFTILQEQKGQGDKTIACEENSRSHTMNRSVIELSSIKPLLDVSVISLSYPRVVTLD